MNRRNFIETGLTAGVAAASTGIPQAQGRKRAGSRSRSRARSHRRCSAPAATMPSGTW